MLEVVGVAKSFGPTQALIHADLALHHGETLALMGENGSGKSTLVKILSGVHRPDKGTVQRPQLRRPIPGSPREAMGLGTVAVYQEILVVPSRSVLDNVWLGTGGFFRNTIPDNTKVVLAQQLLEELLGTALNLKAPAGALSVSQQQCLCIVRALIRDPNVLILDESTSALDVESKDRLFALLRKRQQATGMATIFISHRMDEVTEFADRAVVLRSGRTVGTVERSDISPEWLVRLMTGSEHLVQESATHLGGNGSARKLGAPLLTVSGLRLSPASAPIELTVHAGEIVGLAGLEGHGQYDFLNAVAAGSHEAEITVHGHDGPTPIRSRRDGLKAGIAFVPRDRRGEGIFPSLSTLDNFSAATLNADRRWGLLSNRDTRKRFGPLASSLHIKSNDLSEPITTLSGGNQQKVIIARWLAVTPRVLLLSDPTRGVDLGAKRDVYEMLRRLADDGVGVVMLSSEIEELVALMDRVLVFRENSVFSTMPADGLDRDSLVASFFGRHSSPGPASSSHVESSDA